ncbi:hypothetical protein HK100_011082 [Physocladia obscura]|uniref:Proteasome inhibitor PI31 subunit n=1 Tax=Physocladia obscura TaxID=109957 RepID=A0AAD5T351_9FUNG|nr:hypothetical protein HK100_011082 [Physocladia obscura]
MSQRISEVTVALINSTINRQDDRELNQPVTVRILSASDLTMLLLHSQLQVLGFRTPPSQSSVSTSNDSNSPQLPQTWNGAGTGSGPYDLSYRHTKSALSFALKAVVLANKLLVHCVAVEDGSIFSLELPLLQIYASSATFPLVFTPPTSAIQSELTAEEDATAAVAVISVDENPVVALFADGVTGIEELLYKFKTAIVDKVAPNLNKEGYQPPTNSGTSSASRQGRDGNDADDAGLRDPRFIRPRVPIGGGGYGGFGIGTGGVGGDIDLDPFSAAPGIIPPRGGLGGGGGLYVGPGHPVFGGGGGYGGFGSGGGGIYGGPGGDLLPPGAVPPGARFDPIGPFGGRPSGGLSGGSGRGGWGVGNPFGDGGFGGGVPSGRGGRGGRGGGAGGNQGGSGRLGGAPDNDDFGPPGFDDDMYT